MIITRDEFTEMGFSVDEKHIGILESCIKRAEFVIDGLTGGRASAVLQSGGVAAEYVKLAAAFQTSILLKRELAGVTESSAGERVAIGDFSYYKTSSSSGAVDDGGKTAVRLLRAAGCLYGGTEVRE